MSAVTTRATDRARINEQINVPKVRLIDNEGEQLGIVSREEALRLADEADLDLVEVSPNADPPVCRIMNYGKHLFEQSKKHKKQRQIHLKEIKFRPTTDEGDVIIKTNKLKRFLENGDKVKVTVRFRGREMAHKEIGLDIVDRVKADLEEYGTVEQEAKLEGRQIIMVIAPKRK